MRRWRYVRLTIRQRVAVWLTVLLLTAGAVTAAAVSLVSPRLTAMCADFTSAQAEKLAASVADEVFAARGVGFDAFLTAEKDGNGRIIALQRDMALCHETEAAIEAALAQRLLELDGLELTGTWGKLTGIAALEDWGPVWRAALRVKGSGSAVFRNETESAGADRIRHRLLLEVSMPLRIRCGALRTTAQAVWTLPVVETVIVSG